MKRNFKYILHTTAPTYNPDKVNVIRLAMKYLDKNVDMEVASADLSKKVVTLLSGDPRLKCELINEKRDCGAVGRRGSLETMGCKKIRDKKR